MLIKRKKNVVEFSEDFHDIGYFPKLFYDAGNEYYLLRFSYLVYKKYFLGKSYKINKILEKYFPEIFDSEKLKKFYYDNYYRNKSFNQERYEFAKTILFPLQLKIIDKMLNSNFSGVLKLDTGSGKTVISSFYTYITNKRTLFIVDNKKLLDQYIDKVKQFIPEEYNEVNIIEGKLEKFLEEDNNDIPLFNVITVQKLLSFIDKKIKERKDLNEYIKKFGKIFDCVIYDESHTTGGAKKFSKSSILFNDIKELWGLTATPYNKGEEKYLFLATFGSNIIQLTREENLNLRLDLSNFILTTFKPENEKRFFMQPMTDLFFKLYPSMLEKESNKIIYVLKNRLKDILNKDERHTILITVRTINLGKKIYQELSKDKEFEKSPIDFIYSKNKQLKPGTKIIISTLNFSKKGLDIPEISYIINFQPLRSKNSLIQLIGRALRLSHNKKDIEITYEEIIPRKYYQDFRPDKIYFLKEYYPNVKIKQIHFRED